MNKVIDTWNSTRFATPADIQTYKEINKLLKHFSNEKYETIVEACSCHAFFGGNKTTYARMRYWAKKIGVKPAKLMIWYYMTD